MFDFKAEFLLRKSLASKKTTVILCCSHLHCSGFMTTLCLTFLPCFSSTVMLDSRLKFNQKPFSSDNTLPDFQIPPPVLNGSVASLWQLPCPDEQRMQHLPSYLWVCADGPFTALSPEMSLTPSPGQLCDLHDLHPC